MKFSGRQQISFSVGVFSRDYFVPNLSTYIEKVFACLLNKKGRLALSPTFVGSLESPSELHKCYIPIYVRKVVDFDTMCDGNYQKSRIKLPEIF